MTRLRVGIVGAGWGLTHAAALRGLPDLYEPRALWTRRPERLAGSHPRPELDGVVLVRRWEDVVASPDIDLVAVAAPDDLHHQIVMAAVRAGKHVLCEKPLAAEADDAVAMLHAARVAGVGHFTGFCWRFTAPSTVLDGLVRDGTLGELRHVDISFRIGAPHPAREWQLRRRGGVFANLMTHLVDLVRYFARPSDQEPAAAEAEGWRIGALGDGGVAADGPEGVLSRAWLHLESAHRPLTARLEATQDWSTRGSEALRIELHGSRSSAVGYANPLRPAADRVELIEGMSQQPTPVEAMPPSLTDATGDRSAGAYLTPPTRRIYEGIHARLVSGSAAGWVPTFEDGVAAQQIVDGALDLASTQRLTVVHVSSPVAAPG